MNGVFYVSAAVAIVSTLLAISRVNVMHGLLYLIVSLFSVATIFLVLGAPFAAALEVIVYAGAIMVLIVFVVMIVNPGPRQIEQRGPWLHWRMWIGPGLLGVLLIAELIVVLNSVASTSSSATRITAEQVGAALFGPYLLGVELASMLLLAGLIGAYHLGRREETGEPQRGQVVIEKAISVQPGVGGNGQRRHPTSPPQQQPEGKIPAEAKEAKPNGGHSAGA